MAVPLRESVRKDVFPHDGRTADEKPGNVPPYADGGHRYPLSSFSHDGMAMVRKPGVTMPDFSALPRRATLSLVLSRNAPLVPSLPADTKASLPMPILMNNRYRFKQTPDPDHPSDKSLLLCKLVMLISLRIRQTHHLEGGR